MILNVNTSALNEYTKKLQEMHRSALPVAIRGALNKAAFDVKQNTMPDTASKVFVNRNKNFFKANSLVLKADGFNISSMKSTVGFSQSKLQGSNNYAIDDLEMQERGGNIQKKSFIPITAARGGSEASLVKPSNRLSKIKRIVNSNNVRGKNPKEQFVKSVIHAGRGGYVLSNYKNKQILWRVNSINRTKSGSFKLTPLYSFDKGRSVSVKATHFMHRASIQSASKMNQFFKEEAERQFAKMKK